MDVQDLLQDILDPADPMEDYRRSRSKEEEDVPRRPANPSLQLVESVTESNVVQTLQLSSVDSLVLDETTEQQFQQVLGYVPIDWMNKSVQARFLQTHPEYEHAFKNKLTKGFLQGITKASMRMCNGLMLAAISRCMLDEVLSRMGLRASARRDLVDLSMEIQRRMVDITHKTQHFVETMAEMIKEMGKVALLLEYQADTNMLVDKLKNMSIRIQEQANELKQDEQVALEPLIRATAMIQELLQSDTKYQEEKEVYDRREQEYHDAQDAGIELRREYWKQRVELEGAIVKQRQRMANMVVTKAMAQKQIDRYQDNLRHLDGTIQRYQESKEKYQEDHRLELVSSRQMVEDLKNSMRSVAQARMQTWQEETQSLQKQKQRFADQVLTFREASQHASDGVETREHTSESSALFGIFSSKQTHTQTIHHPNEKLRLEKMASQAHEEYLQMTDRIAEMQQQGGRQIMSEMQELMDSNRANEVLDRDKQAADGRLAANLASLDAQIAAISSLKRNVEDQLEQSKNKLAIMMEQEEKLKEDCARYETSLVELNSEDGVLNKQMKNADRREQIALENYERQRLVLQTYIDKFGEQSDYAVFMRLFGLLNGSVKNLPVAMEMLSTAFEGAQKTFGHDIFQENLESLPEEGRRRLLQDVAGDMQNVCIIAWDSFEAPMLKLVQSDARAVLDPIVRHSREQQMMRAAQSLNSQAEDDQSNARQAIEGGV